jgi:hypothetical protein
MLGEGIVNDFPESLRERVRKLDTQYDYYRGTVAGFLCKCGGLVIDDFMSHRTLPEDTKLVEEMESHAKACADGTYDPSSADPL